MFISKISLFCEDSSVSDFCLIGKRGNKAADSTFGGIHSLVWFLNKSVFLNIMAK